MLKTLIPIASALLLPTAAAAEQSFYKTHLAPPCYARAYDEAHMAAHPRQRVTQFYVTANGSEDAATHAFIVDFGFTVKDSADVYFGSASCDSTPDVAKCWADGDGGTFTLEAFDGGLEVRVGPYLALEGRASFSPDLGQGGDDKVIRLYPGTQAACDLP